MSHEFHRLRRWPTVRRLLAVTAAVGLALAPLVFLHVNRGTFGLPQVAINFSWLAILCGGAGVAGVFVFSNALIDNLRLRRANLVVLAAICATATMIVAVAYVGSRLSTKAWGDTLTYQIVWQAVAHPWSSLDLVGASARSKLAIVAASAAAIVVGFGLLTALYAFILSELGRLTRHGARLSRTATATGLSLFVCAAIFGGLSLHIAITKPQRLVGEPLIGFVGVSSTSNLLTMDSERALAALQDHEAAVSYRVPATFEKKNVILIFSDALRADRLDFYGYERPTTPFLSSLYAAGKLAKVEMAVSPCAESYCGIATTLSSRPYHQLSDENFKLNEVLKKAGYGVNYFLSGEHKAWRFLWRFYGKEFDRLVNVPSTDDKELVQQFLATAIPADAPQFLYFFLMSTHVLGKKLPEFDIHKPSEFGVDLLLRLITQRPSAFDAHGVALYPPLEEKDRIGLSNRYDNGVTQSDAMIRDIFAGLDSKGLLKNSIVVILADHGDGLGERGHVAHARFLYQKDIHVPLLIYDDDPSRYVNREFASLVDVAPTIVDRLGLPLPKSWQGVPLTGPSGPRITAHQTRWREKPCAGAIHKTDGAMMKYIRCRWEGRPDSEEVFNLIADPDELVNIALTTPEAEMRAFRSQTAPRFRKIVCPGNGDNCISDY